MRAAKHNHAGGRLEAVSQEHMRHAMDGRNNPMPLEQREAWRAYEESQGHLLFGRYLYHVEDALVAAITLYRYQIAGVSYVWAKHGPVWFKEQSPEREAQLRELLAIDVHARDKSIAFIRMHARYQAPDLHELLGSITYDRTFVIDLTPGTPEGIAAAMPKNGRRGVLRAKKVAEQAGAVCAEETGLSREAFEEVYNVLAETADRDGFGIHPSQVYWDMLTTLGPKHARLWVLRVDGVPHSWVLTIESLKDAHAYYGASSNASQKFRAAEALDYYVCCELAKEGKRGYDLMGADSPRVPELYSVGMYKKRFAHHPTEVDGAWDVPLRPALYRSLKLARDAKRALRRRTERED